MAFKLNTYMRVLNKAAFSTKFIAVSEGTQIAIKDIHNRYPDVCFAFQRSFLNESQVLSPLSYRKRFMRSCVQRRC